MKSLFAPLALLAALPALTAVPRLTGSDLIGPAVATEVTGQVRAAGGTLETDFRGSLEALRALREGKTTVALVFLRDEHAVPELKSGEWLGVPVAYQPVYVAVHKVNGAKEIDLATLAGLYGKTTDTRFDTWKCLPDSGLSQTPLVIAPHPGKGLAVSLVRAEVLGGGEFRESVRFANNDADAESRAVTSVNAIVLLPRPPKTGNLKVLDIADGRPGKPTQAYSPTTSNLNSGDYPLRVTLFALLRKTDMIEARPTLRAALSEQVSNTLRDNGLHPSSENIRKKFTQTLDELK